MNTRYPSSHDVSHPTSHPSRLASSLSLSVPLRHVLDLSSNIRLVPHLPPTVYIFAARVFFVIITQSIEQALFSTVLYFDIHFLPIHLPLVDGAHLHRIPL